MPEGDAIEVDLARLAPEVTIDMAGCARCDGDGHPGVTFRPLRFPVEQEGAEPLTHWAPCPTNGEPILLRFADAP